MKKTLLVVFSLLTMQLLLAQSNPPKRELRGAWIATYANIDWPSRTQTPAQQRAALITILDHHKATGINVIYLQVRSQCDAMYASSIEPWSADLTGVQGRDPGWDPLQFAIEESHNRGIELHAWLNPYRAAANFSNPALFTENHVTKQHPDWLMASSNLRTLNPGIPAVRDYIMTVINDLVSRYDIDGVHFDDYFYPNAAFNDDAAYAADPRGITDRGDWRRDNVNLLVKRVNETIIGLKPWVKFGISPTGIYRNSTNAAIGTNTTGLQHYVTLFADSRKWLQEGWVDYLAPQVYWYIGQPGANYGVITPWWNNQAAGRHIYIGMAGYKVNDPAQGVNWANPSQIPNQVRMNRSYTNIYGQAIYNTSSLRSTTKLGFRDSLKNDFYRKPALLPTMPWRDATPPQGATNLQATPVSGGIQLTWNTPPATTVEMDKVRQFVIYRSTSPTIDIEDAENILTITNTAITAYTDATVEPNTVYYYTITALDRFHNESIASNVSDYVPPVVTCPGIQEVTLDALCTTTLPNFTAMATATDDVSAAAAITITQLPAAGTVVSGVGTQVVTITATDEAGNSASCTFTVNKVDKTAPLISNISATPNTLTFPNHKMRDVQITYNATDNCSAVTTRLSVTSNEAENGTGDGNTEADWVVVDNHSLKLRAERSGNGADRVYTITITATDAYGNESTQQVTVTVPHDRGNTVITKAEGEAGSENFGLQLAVMPNPTTDKFIVTVTGIDTHPITLKVRDAAGRLLESRTGLVNGSTYSFGSQYRPGLYYAEIQQGTEIKTIKLIKQKN